MSTVFEVRAAAVASLLGLGCSPFASGLGDGSGATSTNVGSSTTTPAPTTATQTSAPDDSESASDSAGSTSTTSGPVDPDDSGDSSGTGEPEPWPTGQFRSVEPVGMLNSGSDDDDPSLTGDRLEIVFASTRDGDEDIYTSRRASLEDDWDMPTRIEAVRTGDPENTPEISSDGLILMFARDPPGSGGMDPYISYRESRGGAWLPPTRLMELSSDELEIAPTLTVNLEQMYMCSQRPKEHDGNDLWVSEVTMAGGMLSFGVLTRVPGTNTDASECAPALSPDRRHIFFDSDREGRLRVWTASRDESDGMFDYGMPLDEINEDGSADIDPWISLDGHVLYFASDRDGGLDIFRAER